ncbi:hypothetical protein V6N11_079005 [Hibiscus sabdariffa]|uniref:RNase H type-1 domain-containing protein n=1 Tax=Hibiscus sabdariffa TaxID=183260 RepID=A0ABR2RUT1_9ROSI
MSFGSFGCSAMRAFLICKGSAIGRFWSAELCERDWVVQVRHVERAGNQVADALVKIAKRDSSEVEVFEHPSSGSILLLLIDSGISVPE